MQRDLSKYARAQRDISNGALAQRNMGDGDDEDEMLLHELTSQEDNGEKEEAEKDVTQALNKANELFMRYDLN